MKTKLLAGIACACAIALSGCNTLGGVAGPTAGGSDLLDTVKTISSNCTGAFTANLTFAPPLPPSGSLVVNQMCGTSPTPAAKAAAAQP
jgi:hypothetical protein